MKLIIFELAGKKAAKRCHTIDDIIDLGNSMLVGIDPDNDKNMLISSEIMYLENDPKFVHESDTPEHLDKTPSFISDVKQFSLRVLHPYGNGGVTTIFYNSLGDKGRFHVVRHTIKKDRLGYRYYGNFTTDDENLYSLDENINLDDMELKNELATNLSYYRRLIMALLTGELELKAAEYVPMVKYGRYHIKPSTMVRHRKPCLVASHDRAEHYKVLRSPRYYKDGIVPENEDELRRIPVKGCHVKRDIERVVIQ